MTVLRAVHEDGGEPPLGGDLGTQVGEAPERPYEALLNELLRILREQPAGERVQARKLLAREYAEGRRIADRRHRTPPQGAEPTSQCGAAQPLHGLVVASVVHRCHCTSGTAAVERAASGLAG